jgi:hypothetical protein
MRLAEYLDAKGYSAGRLADALEPYLSPPRKIPRGTILAIRAGGGCRSDVAHAIIEATRADPTHDGAYVTLRDLVRQPAVGGAASVEEAPPCALDGRGDTA